MTVEYMLRQICASMPVVLHPEFASEFSSLVQNTGLEDRIARVLLSRMELIRTCGLDFLCSSGNRDFEKLRGSAAGLYSIHIKGNNMNYRVLLTCTSSGKILLHTFYERGGKKNTNYAKAIEIAKKRMQELTAGRR